MRAPWWRGWGRRRMKEYRSIRHRDRRMDWSLLPLPSLMKHARQPLMGGGGGSVNAGDCACMRPHPFCMEHSRRPLPLIPLAELCRAGHASLLLLRGRWDGAEAHCKGWRASEIQNWHPCRGF